MDFIGRRQENVYAMAEREDRKRAVTVLKRGLGTVVPLLTRSYQGWPGRMSGMEAPVLFYKQNNK